MTAVKIFRITARRKYNAPQRRRDLCDAAIDVLGNFGSRGLTHAKVDQRAGLPAGTTSYNFRTRDALLLGIAERLDEHDTGPHSSTSKGRSVRMARACWTSQEFSKTS